MLVQDGDGEQNLQQLAIRLTQHCHNVLFYVFPVQEVEKTLLVPLCNDLQPTV